MLDDYNFYKNIIMVLKQKLIFNEEIWKYSLKYNDIDMLQEYLFNLGKKKY